MRIEHTITIETDSFSRLRHLAGLARAASHRAAQAAHIAAIQEVVGHGFELLRQAYQPRQPEVWAAPVPVGLSPIERLACFCEGWACGMERPELAGELAEAMAYDAPETWLQMAPVRWACLLQRREVVQ